MKIGEGLRIEISKPKNNELVKMPECKDWKSFKYEDIFSMTRGLGPTANEAKKNIGSNPYIGASAENNGITQYTSIDCCHEENCITVSNNGSIGEAFYQPKDFLASSDVTVLKSKFPMNPQVGLFICTLIKAERYKYNYGRKWGMQRMKDSIIKLPVDKEGSIDTELITKYMNSLSYSKYL